MILFFFAGFVATFGTIKMFNLFLGKKKEEGSIGAHINLYFYSTAVFLPFAYIIWAVAFGLGVLFMFSLEFEARIQAKAISSLAVFIILITTRILVGRVFHFENGPALYVFTSLVVFFTAGLLLEIKTYTIKNEEKRDTASFRKEMEEEKNKLISQNLMENISNKAKTRAQLQNALELLGRYKLEELEALLKKMLTK